MTSIGEVYEQGQAAFGAGEPVDDNPFQRGVKTNQNGVRIAWFDGWYDAWLAKKWPQWFGQ